MRKDNLIIIAISVIIIGVSMYLLRDIDTIPIHYNIRGEVDNYGSKYVIIGLALIAPVISLLMDGLTAIDPKRTTKVISYERKLKYLFVGFFDILIILMIASMTLGFNPSTAIFSMVGILMLIIAAVIPYIDQNYFIGVKLPWTLEDNDTWVATHKRARPVFITIGLAIFATGISQSSIVGIISLAVGVSSLVYLCIYSYQFYKKRDK